HLYSHFFGFTPTIDIEPFKIEYDIIAVGKRIEYVHRTAKMKTPEVAASGFFLFYIEISFKKLMKLHKIVEIL
ncbi:MAG: hypothetical protein ACI4GV_08515, partial [Acutalibacteraceae bacterium]